jgi:hypothetical protein
LHLLAAINTNGHPYCEKERPPTNIHGKGAAASAIKAKTPQPRQFGRAAERSGEIGFAPPPRSSRSLKAFWSNNETKKPASLSPFHLERISFPRSAYKKTCSLKSGNSTAVKCALASINNKNSFTEQRETASNRLRLVPGEKGARLCILCRGRRRAALK